MAAPLRIDELTATSSVSAGSIIATITGGNTRRTTVGDIITTAATFTQSGTGAVVRTVAAKARDTIHAKDFGWIGDGTSHPLSGIYGSLAAAQADYPHVTSLSQEIDWAALQAAINLFSNGRAATAAGQIEIEGVGLINEYLVYGGSAAYSLNMIGKDGGSGGIAQGTALKWTGTVGKSMLVFMGASRGEIKGINLWGENGVGLENCIHLASNVTVNTTLSAGVSAGSSVVATPASMSEIAVGTALAIDAGGAQFEVVYVDAIDATTFTARFTKDHNSGAQVGGSAGSSGMKFTNMQILVPSGAATTGILMGNAKVSFTSQVSELKLNNVMCWGYNADGSAYSAIRMITGGNVKNLNATEFGAFGFNTPVALEAGAGAITFTHPNIGGTTVVDFLHTAGGTLNVIGLEAESATGHKMLSGGGSGAQACFQGCSWECSAGTDDIVVDYSGPLTLLNNVIMNSRTASSFPKIRSVSQLGQSTPSSIISIGNWYRNATEADAVFYESANPIKFNSNPTGSKYRLFSLNDLGGNSVPWVPLTPIMGPTTHPHAAMHTEGVASGITFDAIGQIVRTYQKVTIPYTALQVAALTSDLKILDGNVRTKIVGIYADTTVAFAGTAGTLLLRVGTTSGGQELILDHDVKTAVVTAGLLDTDLGASITRAAAVQGGVITSWGAAANPVYVRLTSSVGNLDGLTAGSVTVYVIIDKML